MKNETMDRLTGSLIGIARATDGNSHLLTPAVAGFIVRGLACREPEEALIQDAARLKQVMVPNCFQCAAPCGRTADFNMAELDSLEPEERRKKLLLLDRIRLAAARPDARAQGAFFSQALIAVGLEYISPAILDQLLAQAEALLSP